MSPGAIDDWVEVLAPRWSTTSRRTSMGTSSQDSEKAMRLDGSCWARPAQPIPVEADSCSFTAACMVWPKSVANSMCTESLQFCRSVHESSQLYADRKADSDERSEH